MLARLKDLRGDLLPEQREVFDDCLGLASQAWKYWLKFALELDVADLAGCVMMQGVTQRRQA